jgi:hypothetical protein
LRLDLADPALRTLLHPRCARTGTLAWHWLGEDVAAINYAWAPGASQLTLTFVANGQQTRQRVRLDATQPHFGGTRRWFVCPWTGGRARVLFLPVGAREWASRRAHRLTYASQRATASERALRRFIDSADFGKRRNHVRRIVRRQRSGARSIADRR